MYYCRKIGENKVLETTASNDLNSLHFEFNVSFRTQCSHAGFFFLFCFYKFKAEFNIYDVRHWNYGEKCFEDSSAC